MERGHQLLRFDWKSQKKATLDAWLDAERTEGTQNLREKACRRDADTPIEGEHQLLRFNWRVRNFEGWDVFLRLFGGVLRGLRSGANDKAAAPVARPYRDGEVHQLLKFNWESQKRRR